MNIIEMHSHNDNNFDNNVPYTYDPYNPYNQKNNTINNEKIGANFLIFLFIVFISGIVIYNICNSCDQFRRNYFVSHNISPIIQANIIDHELDQTNEIDEPYEVESPIADNDSDELISYSELMASQSHKI